MRFGRDVRKPGRVGRAWVAVASTLLGALVWAGALPEAAAQVVAGIPAPHGSLVPQTPARGYPIILKTPAYTSVNINCPAGCATPREVLASEQVGRYIVSGGNFRSVLLQDGSTITRANFAAWNIDTKQIVCPSMVFDNEVTAVAAGPTATKVYVGGRFTKVTGGDGIARTRNKIALIDLATCSVDTSFVSTGSNGKIDAIVYGGGRLFIGGDFTTIGGQAIDVIAELNPVTATVNTALNPSFSGGLASSKVRDLALNSAGTRLIMGGRFGTITMGAASRTTATAIIDVTSPAAPTLTAHSFSSPLALNYLQDVSVSPDGQRIGLAYGTATVADYVYLVSSDESPRSPLWVHAMGDSSFGIAVSNNAVYVSGHFCKVAGGPGVTDPMGPKMGLDTCSGAILYPNGAWRSHIAALSLSDGTPLPWNPGQDSFVGGRDLTVTTRGLLVGYDGERINGIRVGALGFLDFGPGVEDATPPSTVTFTAPAAGATVGNPARISGSATDNLAVSRFRVRIQHSDGRYVQADGTLGATVYDFRPTATNNAFNLDVNLAIGTYTASAKTIDAANLESTAWATRSFTESGAEGVKPQATIVVPLPDAPTESNLIISGRATDNVMLNALRLRVRNAAGLYLQSNGTLATTAANLAVSTSPALPAAATDWTANLGATLPAATYTIELRATDAAGNQVTATGSVIVSSIQRTTGAALTSYTSNLGVVAGYTMGYVFTVDREMSATALGMLDSNGNGVMNNTAPGTVGLWDHSTRALLATATIPTNATAEGKWFYAAPAQPVTLQPGKRYVVAALYNGEPYTTGGTVTTFAGVSVTHYAIVAGSTFTYPESQAAATVAYAMPNIKLSYVTANLAPVIAPSAPVSPVRPAAPISFTGNVTDNAVVESVTLRVRDAAGAYVQDDGTIAAAANDLPRTASGLGTSAVTYAYELAGGLPVGSYTITVVAADGVGNTTTSQTALAVTALDPARPAVTAYSGFSLSTGSYVMGYTFTVATTSSVTSLGMFDSNGNGVIDNAGGGVVGLWRQSDQALLASATIPVGTPSESGWFYGPTAQSVSLQPGVTYLVASVHAGELFPYLGTLTTAAGVTRGGYAYQVWAGALVFPSAQGVGVYGAPNFKFAAEAGAAPVAAVALGAEQPAAAALEAPVPAPTLTLGSPVPAAAVVGTPVPPLAVVANDADSPVTFSATALPSGLVIDPTSGVVTGTPSSAGLYEATVTATTATGMSATFTLWWTIS